MFTPEFMNAPDLPLELEGFEARSARDVFELAVVPDAALLLLLESCGYAWKTNINLADGRVVDGWMKI